MTGFNTSDSQKENLPLIVSKFGGTSMGNAECMLRSAEISLQKKSFLICVSATSGTTNQLISIGQKAEQGQSSELISELINKHLKIAAELNLSTESKEHQQLLQLFEELRSVSQGMQLLKDCSPRALDILVSLGERISSVLFVQALKIQISNKNLKKNVSLLDAREIIKTDQNFGCARPLIHDIEKMCHEKIKSIYNLDKDILVTQGFIGSTLTGHSTTLGRGGSDYSAALFAEGLSASALEIWTDVPGIATTDPRLCRQAQFIEEVSFKEASELAVFGAKVLHPATVEPAVRKNIPVFVGSSFDPATRGTWIKKEVNSSPLVRAMALRKNQNLVTLTTPQMLQTHGFLFKIFKVFNDHQISIDAITTSEISVSVTIDSSFKLSEQIIKDLEMFAEVKIESGLSLVSLIGNNINHTPGLAQKIFTAIQDINVRMICLGASKHNFCFLVSSDCGELAIQKLHQAFIA